MPIKVAERRVAPGALQVSGAKPLPASAFGATEAQALETAGRAVSAVGETQGQLAALDQAAQAKEEARQLKLRDKLLKEQEARYKANVTDAVTISKGAINEKVLQVQGLSQNNAKGATADYKAFYEKTLQEGSVNLQSDREKELYRVAMDPYGLTSRGSVMKHEQQETKKGRIATYSASQTNSVDNGISFVAGATPDASGNYIRSYNDSVITVGLEEDAIKRSAQELADEQGWSKEEREKNESENISKMYEEIVRQWAYKDIEFAKLSYETNKDKIAGDKRDDLVKLLDEKNVAQMAQDATESILIKTDNERDALAAKDQISDPEVRAQTNANIKDKYSTDRRLLKQDRDNYAYKMNGELFSLSRLPDVGMTQLKDHISTAPENERAGFEKYARALIDDRDKDIPKVTDAALYSNVMDNINKGKYRDRQALQVDTIGFTKKDADAAERFFNGGGIIGTITEPELKDQYRLNFKDRSPYENPEEYHTYRQYIVDQATASGKADASPTDLSRWSAEAYVKFTLPGEKKGGGAGYGEDITYGEALALGREVARDWLPDVSSDDETRIAPILLADGIRATKRNIRIYKKYKEDLIELEF